MATEPEILAILARLSRAYQGLDLAPETIEAYVEDLSDQPAELLARACAQLRQSSRFFPSIAEIRAECAKLHPEIPAYHRRYLPPAPEPEEVPMPPEARAAFDRLKEALVMEKRAKDERFNAERELWRQRSLRRAEREANQGGNS